MSLSTRPSSAMVTVILTTYNEEGFVPGAIDGVLRQRATFPVELVVIDDGSTDSTPDLLREYQRRYPEQVQLRLLATNTGDNAAFMEAIHAARSPYLAFLDGDDYWTEEDKLQRQVDALEANPDCALCYHNVAIESVDMPGEGALAHPAHHPERLALSDFLEWCDPYTCAVMVRRSALGTLPAWYQDETCADWALFLRATRAGDAIYLPRTMGVYRRHSSGFWTRLDATTRRRVEADFYRDLPDRLPSPHARRIAQLRIRTLLQLAAAADEAGRGPLRDGALAEALAVGMIPAHGHWALRKTLGTQVEFGFADGNPMVVWCEVRPPLPMHSYDAQLSYAHFAVKRGRRYLVTFRGRADQDGFLLTVGCSAAHEPWNGLGLYQEVCLGRDWDAVRLEFEATSSEHDSRLHFDLGGMAGRLELKELSVQDAEGTPLRTTLIPGRPS